MATVSERQRLAAVATDAEEAVIRRPGWSTAVALQNPEQARNDSPCSRWPRRLLDLLWERMRWRGTEQGNGLPLPTTTGNPQSRSWLCRAINSTKRSILRSARGREGGDTFSSRPLLCSAALSFICGEQLFGNTNTSTGSSWMQLLRAIALSLWGLSYYSYMAEGTPATMSDRRREWLVGLTVVLTLGILIWLHQSPLALPGIAGIITLSTAAALWIQTLLIKLLRLASALSVNEPT